MRDWTKSIGNNSLWEYSWNTSILGQIDFYEKK